MHEQAAAWIARLDDTRMSEGGVAELKRWVNQSEAHKKVLMHTARVWERMDAMAGLSELLSLDDIMAKRQLFAIPVISAIAAALVCVGILVYYTITMRAPRGRIFNRPILLSRGRLPSFTKLWSEESTW